MLKEYLLTLYYQVESLAVVKRSSNVAFESFYEEESGCGELFITSFLIRSTSLELLLTYCIANI